VLACIQVVVSVAGIFTRVRIEVIPDTTLEILKGLLLFKECD